jgi:predicted nucleic acid-binding protein
MIALVDSPVWSEYFRRKSPHPAIQDRVEALLAESGALIIGPIRQELLSGLKDSRQFERLRVELRKVRDFPIQTTDYELAAEFSNTCRESGIQGSAVDFLICGVATRLQVEIFTLDADFERYRKVLPISLHSI